MNREFSVAWLPLLEEIADRADEIALAFFRASHLAVERKADLSPVTEADRAIEDMARAVVGKRHPELGVYGEEQGESTGTAPTRLIIDPIDGTRNFVRGIPIFATLLAVEEAGEIVAGVVSAPAMRSRWRAARGQGAFHGSRRLSVSTVDRLEQVQLFHGDLGGTTETTPPPAFKSLLDRVERSRGFGDFYQHVLVAEGAGELAFDAEVNPWDIAPLLVLVEEAGGRATSVAGERTIYGGTLVTSNGRMHQVMLDALGHGSPAPGGGAFPSRPDAGGDR